MAALSYKHDAPPEQSPGEKVLRQTMHRLALLVLVFLFVGVQAGPKQNKNLVTNKPPVISKFESSSLVVRTCEQMGERAYCGRKTRRTVSLSVSASDPEGDPLTYEYTVTGGEILGAGANVSWKLGDQRLGDYSVTVKVLDSKGAAASSTTKVVVRICDSCGFFDPPCPIIEVTGSDAVTNRGEILRFHGVVVSDAYFQSRPDYIWTVTNAKILRGQHTPWLTVETTGEPGQDVTAVLAAEGGFDASCMNKGSATARIQQ